jgi:hypothetical protein
MSTFRTPVGPQPSSVYWRRRIVVGLALLAVIVIILLLFFQPKGAPPTSPNTAPTASPTGPATSASTDPQQPCAPGVVDITASTDKNSYSAGEKPQITLTVTNKGATACTLNAGTTQQEYLITSGSELYWNSRDCQTDAVDSPVVLQPNKPVSTSPLTWDRVRSSPTTCDSARNPVPAGGASYHLNINLGELKSNDVQFILN